MGKGDTDKQQDHSIGKIKLWPMCIQMFRNDLHQHFHVCDDLSTKLLECVIVPHSHIELWKRNSKKGANINKGHIHVVEKRS